MAIYANHVYLIPKGKTYCVWGNGPYADYSEKLLLARGHNVGPRVQSTSSKELREGVGVVVSTVDFIQVVHQLRSPSLEVYILLHPVGDPWGYYELTKNVIQEFELRDNGVLIHEIKKFYTEIAKVGSYLTEDNGQFLVNRGHFFPSIHDIVAQNKETVEFVVNRFGNEQSQKKYMNVLNSNEDGIFSERFQTLFTELQYCDYLQLKKSDVVINGGVEFGSEIPAMVTLMQGEGEIHSFDPMGFEQINDYCKQLSTVFPNILRNHKLALMNYVGEVELGIGETQASINTVNMNKYADGDYPTQSFPCTSIDTFVREHNFEKLNLIKLDVEGADFDVIKGARETIKQFRPQCAFSIYHHPNHYWDIPAYCMNEFENYVFYFNHYSFARWEGILYMIPKEMLQVSN